MSSFCFAMVMSSLYRTCSSSFLSLRLLATIASCRASFSLTNAIQHSSSHLLVGSAMVYAQVNLTDIVGLPMVSFFSCCSPLRRISSRRNSYCWIDLWISWAVRGRASSRWRMIFSAFLANDFRLFSVMGIWEVEGESKGSKKGILNLLQQ